MDLTIIADLLSSINPIVLGSVAGGFLVAGGAGLYIKRNKNKFIENTDPFAQPNDFKTLKTEDLEREFGSLTVQTKMLDEDESLFFDKSPKDKLTEKELTQPSTKLVDEASVFDSFGKQEQAIESLKKAVDIEKYDKERVRLKIVLSQYNIKKGKVSLDDIIKEYPSFHTKVNFGPDNTLSALMGSAIPKTDQALQNSINKEIDKEFDIFADLPILNESVKVTEQNTSHIAHQRNLFDDLPNIEEVSHSKKQDSHSIFANGEPSLFESQPEPIVQTSTQLSLFDDLPTINNINSNNINSNNELSNKEETVQLSTIDNPPTSQVDQFAWSSQDSNDNDTEKMLKDLQNEADKIDKINENEAMDDMQKFWQEFGNMVVDIKKEVAENHKPIKNNSSADVIPFSMTTEHQDTPENDKQQNNNLFMPVSSSALPSLADSLPMVEQQVESTTVEHKEEPTTKDLEPPVLHVVIESSPVAHNSINYSESSVNPITTVSEQKNDSVIATLNTPVNNVSPALVPALNAPVNNNIAVTTDTPVKPQTFKVWANWIVTIEGQQVFKNHFINLKNPWGTIKAGEELYGGISRLSGKDGAGKNYPWVLVSVFPLSKD